MNSIAKVDILVCTINEGIVEVPSLLMPPIDNVCYVVSMQYTEDRFLELIPEVLTKRNDVVLSTIEGRGLSANRNNAISCSKADICIIADDDVRYTKEGIQNVVDMYNSSDADVIIMQSLGPDGKLLRNYPPNSFNMSKPPRFYYPISFEITFRRKSVENILFDTRFGLGSKYMAAGEEDIWIHSLVLAGKQVVYHPTPFVKTLEYPKSGNLIYKDSRKLFTSGAVSYSIYGWTAYLRCFKYAVINAFKGNSSFLFMLKNMYNGIRYIKHSNQHKDESTKE